VAADRPAGQRGRAAQPNGGRPVSDDGRPLIRVTVNLTHRAAIALESACQRTGDSKTDSINRALVVYSLVVELIEREGGHFTVLTQDGQTERIHVL
jgi:hypothetical protein